MRVFLRVCVCWLLQSKQHSNIFACRWDSFLLLTMVLMEEDYRVLHTLYMLYYYQIQGSNASGKNKTWYIKVFCMFWHTAYFGLLLWEKKLLCLIHFSAISIFLKIALLILCVWKKSKLCEKQKFEKLSIELWPS